MTSRLSVGCGAFTSQAVPHGPAAGRAQRDTVEYAELAEELGFDSVWRGEHHFSPDGYTAATFPLLGAMAARTRRVVLGTRVILGPLHPALLLAEDAAQVALLADGRFILGLGIGYRDDEFDSLRVPKHERRSRIVEIVEVCRKAWTGDPFDYDGPTVRAKGLLCRPAPPVPPEIWLGGRATSALARAAMMADGYVATVGGTRETMAAIGELDSLTPADRRPLAVTTGAFALAAVDRTAAEALERGLGAVLGLYEEWLDDEPAIRGGATSDVAVGVVRGDPESVAAALIPRVERLRDREHHLVLRIAYPGMTRHQVEDHMRVLAYEVLPRLRAAAE